MAFSLKVKRSNPKWAKAYGKSMEAARQKEIAVGLPVGQGGIGNAHYDSGASLLDIGTWMEDGTSGGIPSRPWLSDSRPKLHKAFKSHGKQLAPKVKAGKISTETVWKSMAVKAESIVRGKITEGPWEPNSPETIARKGSEKPLIDTGAFRQGIRAIVRNRTRP